MKRRLKKKPIFICLIIILLIIVFISPFFFIDIKLIGSKKIVLNYGDSYSESGYKAKKFNENITDDIKVESNLKEKLGKYKITYSYKFLFYKIKKVRKIEVKDTTGPKIELLDGDDIEVTINEEYQELGYTAIDNYDGDVTDKVKVTNKVDITKLGEYEVIYEVEDSNGNKSIAIRKVNVMKKRPTKMSVEEYTLNGWYEDVKLKKTDNKGDAYFNEITMVGDSNTMYMYLNGYLSGLRSWAIPCLTSTTMHHWEINLYGLGIKSKLIDAVKQYKPEKMILNLGTFSTTWISKEEFIENSNKIIEQIQTISPNTKLMLISLYPITKNGYNVNDFKQDTINKYNYEILEMASKHKIKFLDVQEVLKDESGYGNPAYYGDDCFHLNAYGHSVVKEYIKTHALEEEN